MRLFWVLFTVGIFWAGPFIMYQPWFDDNAWYSFPTIVTWLLVIGVGIERFMDACNESIGGR